MTSLKEATWDTHLRLEKRLAVKARFATLAAYRDHIGRLWAFYAAAETEWNDLLAPALNDLPARRKASLLAEDLLALGGAQGSLAPVPAMRDSASALGGFYVLEGATLGGQHLLPLVERGLGLSASHGAAYLASYGPQVAAMWQRFGAAVEAHCQTPEAQGQAAAAAQSTFLAMEAWLCGEQE